MSERDMDYRLGSVENKVENLEQAHHRLMQRQDKLEGTINQIRDDLQSLRTDIHDDISRVTAELDKLGSDMLNALPKWAAHSLGNHNKAIGALISLLGIVVTALLWIIFHKSA